VLLASGFRNLDQIPGAEPGRFDQNGSRDGDLLVPRQATDHRRRRLGNGRKLGAQLDQSQPGADVGKRRSSMVLIRRSKTSPNSSICWSSKPPADARNSAVICAAVAAHFSAEPAAIAASTSSGDR